MQKPTTKTCAQCRAGVGAIAFKTIFDGYDKDFCDPVCVLRWVRAHIAEIEQPKLQETNV